MIDTVIKNFFPKDQNYSVKPYGKGHINDTYIVAFPESDIEYILQRINTSVFVEPKILINNHLKIQPELINSGSSIQIAELIPDITNEFLFIDKLGGAWRMTSFIKDSYSIDFIDNECQAYQSGLAFGWFVYASKNIQPTDLKEPIKDFHRLSFRLRQLNKAIKDNKADRLNEVIPIIRFFKEREKSLNKIEALIDIGYIPLRVVHNDTKINNILFRDKKVVAVIDLDTVGPGSILYDYGDALRTTANTAAEDEKILEKVMFNINAFKAFNKGYLSEIKSILSDSEKRFLFMAPILMTYIMGIRFLTDYLNGDIYYKTNYPDHNLDRCLVQKKLIESIEANELIIRNIIHEELI
ncbi:MAG: phosphotransferase enzyme family protein [Bacteroidales bacterium]